jgi:glutathione S-transferase
MKLYGSPFSPYARKARVLIIEKNIKCPFVEEDPWAAGTAIPSMNPLGKVPVLELAPGNCLFESPQVVHYLDHLDGKPLPPQDAVGYWEAQRWQALGNGIIDAVIARILESRRPADKQMPEKMQREEGRIARALKLASEMYDGGEFLVGKKFSLADIVMGVALQYIDIRYPHDWRAAHPELAKWCARITARKSFIDTMPPGFKRVV